MRCSGVYFARLVRQDPEPEPAAWRADHSLTPPAVRPEAVAHAYGSLGHGRFRIALRDLQRVAGRKRRTCAQRPRQEGGWQFPSSVEPGLMRDARFGADFAHASSSGSTAGIIAITSRTAMAMLNARAWPGSRSARRTNEPKASHGKLPANPATRNTIANAVA